MTATKVARICSVENCERPHEGLGYCKLHRERFKKYGDATREPYPPILCSIEGCGKKHEGRGYCAKHLSRLRLYGDPLQLSISYGRGETPQERFWSKVDKTPGLGRDGDCWEWRGCIPKKDTPYGAFMWNYKQWRTHRLSYYWATGIMPELEVLHSCDNHRCVNPNHLREGTHADNERDKLERNRHAKGESHGMVKLTVDKVLQLRELFEQGISTRDLMMRFRIGHSQTIRIVKRQSWKHI